MARNFHPQQLDADELTRALSIATGHLPTTTGPASAITPTPTHKVVRKVVQVNFKCSEELAELLAKLGAEAGSTRRFIARMLAAAGYSVPECDINPPDPRKRGTA